VVACMLAISDGSVLLCTFYRFFFSYLLSITRCPLFPQPLDVWRARRPTFPFWLVPSQVSFPSSPPSSVLFPFPNHFFPTLPTCAEAFIASFPAFRHSRSRFTLCFCGIFPLTLVLSPNLYAVFYSPTVATIALLVARTPLPFIFFPRVTK